MARYFAHIAYNGTHYHGWQIQPKAISVQAVLNKAFSTILNTPIEVVGCGRTDAGVHAKNYYLHFDYAGAFPREFVRRINKFLPKDIVVYQIFEVANDAHARFDAYYRSYEYHLIYNKNPFKTYTAWHYPFAHKMNIQKLQQAAALLKKHHAFAPFCKTNSDAKTMHCVIHRSDWEMKIPQQHLVYHVAANRFLRGMVRLIVGMCVNVALDKVSIDEVRHALEHQTTLKKSYSVPPQGLYLTAVRYPL